MSAISCMIVITYTVLKKIICTMYKYSYRQLCERPPEKSVNCSCFKNKNRHFQFEIVVQIFQRMLFHVIRFFLISFYRMKHVYSDKVAFDVVVCIMQGILVPYVVFVKRIFLASNIFHPGTKDQSLSGTLYLYYQTINLSYMVCRWFRFAQLAKGKKSRPQ